MHMNRESLSAEPRATVLVLYTCNSPPQTKKTKKPKAKKRHLRFAFFAKRQFPASAPSFPNLPMPELKKKNI